MDYKSEILFWTGIMRDHAIFQLNGLAPKEIKYVQISMYYMNFFQQMLNRIERDENLETLYPALLNGLSCFIEYKKMLLYGLLTCQLQMNLSPSIINQQINEATEFKELLTMPVKSEIDTPLELVKRVKIWLSDGVVHASALSSFIDPTETILSDEILRFKESFNKLLTKASDLEMMHMKVSLDDGALEFLVEETVKLMEIFICFLEKFKKLRMSCKVLGNGTLSPLIPDHFIREHRYFINKVKTVKVM